MHIFTWNYPISGIFRMGLIFAEFTNSSKSLNMHTAKIRHYNKSLLAVLQIVKIGLGEQLTHHPGVIFAKIAQCKIIPIYGMSAIFDSYLKILL